MHSVSNFNSGIFPRSDGSYLRISREHWSSSAFFSALIHLRAYRPEATSLGSLRFRGRQILEPAELSDFLWTMVTRNVSTNWQFICADYPLETKKAQGPPLRESNKYFYEGKPSCVVSSEIEIQMYNPGFTTRTEVDVISVWPTACFSAAHDLCANKPMRWGALPLRE